MGRRRAALARSVGQIHPVFVARASSAEFWDVEGKRYIDFASGIGVLNAGHCHPEVTDAVRAQLDLFTHTCVQVVGAAALQRRDGPTLEAELRDYVEKKRRVKDGLALEARTKSDYLATIEPSRVTQSGARRAAGPLHPIAHWPLV
jgi:Aminotransferase class-III